tara:strand:- start:390 stop:791 length:402 start_codon:yes stop_codon:yes gene_type:complete
LTDKELSIFVGKDGQGIKLHLRKLGRIGIRGANVSAQLNGIYIRTRSHDDTMKVVGYLGIALTDTFPKEFFRHKFTEETLCKFIGDNGCNIKTICDTMEKKPFIHASLNGILIKARTWDNIEDIKGLIRKRLR